MGLSTEMGAGGGGAYVSQGSCNITYIIRHAGWDLAGTSTVRLTFRRPCFPRWLGG
jgi:hypothetical protein